MRVLLLKMWRRRTLRRAIDEEWRSMKRTWLVLVLAAVGATPILAAINEVHVVNVQPDVQFHKGGSPADAWLPCEKDTVLKAGDEITCDPDGAVTLAFADNSTVVVRNTTQLRSALSSPRAVW